MEMGDGSGTTFVLYHYLHVNFGQVLAAPCSPTVTCICVNTKQNITCLVCSLLTQGVALAYASLTGRPCLRFSENFSWSICSNA